jgi:hypothetical protein
MFAEIDRLQMQRIGAPGDAIELLVADGDRVVFASTVR